MHCWTELVDRYADLVWAVARSHCLTSQEAADVSQTTWLRLGEHHSCLHRPEKIQAWLVTTARRESLRVLATRRRECAVDLADLARVRQRTGRDTADLVAETDVATRLWRAFARLPLRCRQLLWITAYAPDLGYGEVAGLLGIAVGSVGPTRGRCLTALRRLLGGELEVAG